MSSKNKSIDEENTFPEEEELSSHSSSENKQSKNSNDDMESGSNSGSGSGSETDSEEEEEETLYDLMSDFFLNDNGDNVAQILTNVQNSIDQNSKCILKLTKVIQDFTTFYMNNLKK